MPEVEGAEAELKDVSSTRRSLEGRKRSDVSSYGRPRRRSAIVSAEVLRFERRGVVKS